MNERIRDLQIQAFAECKTFEDDKIRTDEVFERFAELIVRECAEMILSECEDFENGNCFNDEALWKSVSREYGKNKERGFNPIGMGIHFGKMLKEHFGVER